MRNETFVIRIEGHKQLAIKASFELVCIYLGIQYVNFVIRDGHLPKRTKCGKCGVDNNVSNPDRCLWG